MALYKSTSRQISSLIFFGVFLVFLIYLFVRSDLTAALLAGRLPDYAALKAAAFLFVTTYGYWIFVGYVFVIGLLLFFENRNPDRTLAWLLVLGALPVVGLLLYWVVGPNFRYFADKRRFRMPHGGLKRPATANGYDAQGALAKSVATVIYSCSGEQVMHASDIQVMHSGQDVFESLLQDLGQAQNTILLESYIIKNDDLGRRVKDTLIERAYAGVTVCVIYDAVGSWRIGSAYVRDLRAAGVHVFPFLPVSFPMVRGANYRNHRKICVVDGSIAYMGGMNIGNEYLGCSKKFRYWRDTHARFCGEAVNVLTAIFLRDLALSGAPKHLQEALVTRQPQAHGGSTLIHIASSGPDAAWDTIQKAVFMVFSRARKRLWLTTPYLVPGDTLIEALCAASLGGADVRVLIPGKADHILVYWASLHSCEDLLRAGVRIFLYRSDSFVHAKTITCDGEVYSIGSANLDTRSLHINFEVQAFIYDKALAKEGEVQFTKDIAESVELTLEAWQERSIARKVKENIGKLFSSLA